MKKYFRMCRKTVRKEPWTQPTDIHRISPELRLKRLKYLWFRVRIIGTASAFILMMRVKMEISDEVTYRKKFGKLYVESDELRAAKVSTLKTDIWVKTRLAWFFFLCSCLWFNLYTTPAIMLYPEINDSLRRYIIASEIAWLLDIFRRIFFNSKEG